MTENEALDLVMQRIGRRTSTELRTQVVTEMDLAKRELENTPPYFWFLRAVTPITLLAGNPYGALDMASSDILALDPSCAAVVRSTDGSAVGSTGGVGLLRVPHSAIQVALTRTGLPEAWAQVSSGFLDARFGFQVYPTPDVDCELAWHYYARQPLSVWLTHAPSLLLARTCRNVAMNLLHNFELADVFAQSEKEARDALNRTHTAMECDEMSLIKGEE